MESKGKNNENGLERAIECYYENPTRETFYRICDELILALTFNLTAICPTEFSGSGIQYKLFETPDYGYAYIVYTSLEKNPEMQDPERYAFIPWRNIVIHVGENSDCSGIVINPYSGHQPCVWVNFVYLRKILQKMAKMVEACQEKSTEMEEPDQETN